MKAEDGAIGVGTGLLGALRRDGFARLRHPLLGEERCAGALDDARAFFALGAADRRRLSIERSPHFRGYSEMRNERDWREQVHFGAERPARAAGPAYARLEGPNLWPGVPAWRARLLRLLDDLSRAGRDALSAIAQALGGGPFLPDDEDPYLLLKLIHYPAVTGGAPRSGVAPHVDFSWITLVLADGEGLAVRGPDGAWREVAPEPGTLVVHAGEILEAATAGLVRATPHRVRSRADGRSRVSMPFFLCPGLDAVVPGRPVPPDPADAADHVHRVLPRGAAESFRFGEAEWRRKGLGFWCARCVG